ncbi:MAG TPA: TlpA disulfide reductase family protein [candidate division Zixibacteria bacterium]|nr:TlpA disulfide reductase family protein [candidate division Zixibacteria bacterium]
MRKITDLRILPAGILLIAIALLSCSGEKEDSEIQAAGDGSQASTTAAPGNAPLFTAQDLDGKWRSSDEWLGKQPVVINFWGTWCPPCRREIPDLVKLNDEYGPKGVALVSLAVNDTPSKVKEYGANNSMNWTLLMAEDQMLVDYKVTTGIPTTIFIDKNGNEITRLIGGRDYATLKQGFDAIL